MEGSTQFFSKAWTPGSIRAMALVESHRMAFQMEDFSSICATISQLNSTLGYMAGLIHFN